MTSVRGLMLKDPEHPEKGWYIHEDPTPQDPNPDRVDSDCGCSGESRSILHRGVLIASVLLVILIVCIAQSPA